MRALRRPDHDLTALADAVLSPGFEGTEPPSWLLRRLEAGLGGVTLFSRNISSRAQLATLIGTLRAANPHVIVALDEEAGDVTRLDAATGSSRPGNYALGVVDDVGLTGAIAADLGWELAALGVTLNYAPDADVNSDVNNPVIGVRSFGGDPPLAARHTAAWVRGHQSAGVAACAKHFPGHGNTSLDSHLDLPVITASRAELDGCELVPFRAAIDAGVRALMTAHLVVPAIDPDRPATLSRDVISGLLRGELGYDGLVVTDGIEMRGAAARYGVAGATVLALAAGVDAICVGGDNADEATAVRLRDAVVDAVRGGDLPRDRLEQAAARVAGLAAWHAAHPARSAHQPVAGDDLGLDAARRALRVTVQPGARPLPLTVPPHVVELAPPRNIAVGDGVPWALTGLLAERLPGTTGRRLLETDPADVSPILDEAGIRPVVLVVRDAHRHPWMSSVVKAVEAARGDCVVVETGIPVQVTGAVHVATHGGSLACRRAAADLLAGSAG